MAENVSHPKHYNFGKIEVMEFINDQQLNYARGCVIKYTCRAGRKDPAKECEDLQKAAWYLQYEIELLTAAQEGRAPRRPNDLNPRVSVAVISATAAWSSDQIGEVMATVPGAAIAPQADVPCQHIWDSTYAIECQICGHLKLGKRHR